LPHERSTTSDAELEEERRLLFVGMTRAEEQLQLSLVQYRDFRGERRPAIPSQFLMELPREEMQYEEPASFDFADDGDGDSFFDDDDDDGQDFDGPSDIWSDEDFVQDSPEEFADALPAGIVTASQMLQQSSGKKKKFSHHIFQRGMLVTHPEYGEGTIISVNGTGVKRKVKVQFDRGGDARSFLLAHSPLEPVLEG
jgi:DNA helicase-2/ATP-dependent DNA helicase PcrA